MDEFDARLRSALADEDEQFIQETLGERGYYEEAWGSLKGPGRAMNILAWIGILAFSAILIFCLVAAFRADSLHTQILFVALAIMANSAQIGMKLWFNMRLNRQAILMEVRKLRLEIARAGPS